MTDVAIRQDADTVVHEFCGLSCDRVVLVPGTRPKEVLAVYLRIDGAWYRLFVDAELLFLDPSGGPCAEDDLAEGEAYNDVSATLVGPGTPVRELKMERATVTLSFESGTSLTIEDVAAYTSFILGRPDRGLGKDAGAHEL